MKKKIDHGMRYVWASISAAFIAFAMIFILSASPATAAASEHVGSVGFGDAPAFGHHSHGYDAEELGDTGNNAGSEKAINMPVAESAKGGKVTVFIYMNGSDLESYGGAATSDIAEMCKSGIGDNANVIIETIGTQEWQDFGIASDHTQRYAVESGKLALVDDSLEQLDTTAPETLSDFLFWGKTNYPADRYILILWDHGAGPVYGFGYDEFQSEESALTLDEMKQALDENSDMHFDFIGMDCCIMGSLETCVALASHCDYAVLSEDFEPGIGWSYERWMSSLEENPELATEELGHIIVDDMVDEAASDEENGDATLALIDESKVAELYGAWEKFAYDNSDTLLAGDISRKLEWNPTFGSEKDTTDDVVVDKAHGSERDSEYSWYCEDCDWEYDDNYDSDDEITDALYYAWLFGMLDFDDDYGYYRNDIYSYDYDEMYDYDDAYASDYGYDDDDWNTFWEEWAYDDSYVTMTDYFVTDLSAAADTADNAAATTLKEALDNAIAYSKTTAGDADLCGLGVTLPYGDGEFYDSLKDVFSKCGFDKTYVEWLEAFTGVAGDASE